MNIAIFTNNYLPNPYGVTTSIESFRKEFEKRGHRVYIFAPNYRNYKDVGKNIFRYPSLDINYKINFPLPIPYSCDIEKKIESLKIDIIHSQHPNLLGSVAWRWAKKKKVPIVFTWHTIYDKYTHYTPIIPKKISTYWVIKNSVNYANSVDKIIIPTQSVRKIIKKWGVKNDNIEAVATGVDETKFENPDAQKIREELGIEKNKKIILSISRLTEEKNVIFLTKQIIGVLKNNPDIFFILGGDGYLRDDLIKIINQSGVGEQVFFTGLIKREEIKDYMDLADIFVYASKSETQGTIITEAMYMGLPIVALSALGINNLIEDGLTGLLATSQNGNFSKKINELLLNNKLALELSKNAKKEAREKYTSKVCADKMLEIYGELIFKKLGI